MVIGFHLRYELGGGQEAFGAIGLCPTRVFSLGLGKASSVKAIAVVDSGAWEVDGSRILVLEQPGPSSSILCSLRLKS